MLSLTSTVMKIASNSSLLAISQLDEVPAAQQAVADVRQGFFHDALRAESASTTAIAAQEARLRDALAELNHSMAQGGCYPLEACSLDVPSLTTLRLTAEMQLLFGTHGCERDNVRYTLPVMDIVRIATTVVNSDAAGNLINTRVLLSLNRHLDQTAQPPPESHTPTASPYAVDEISFVTSSDLVQALDAQMSRIKRHRRVQFEDIRFRKQLLQASLSPTSDLHLRWLKDVQTTVQGWMRGTNTYTEEDANVAATVEGLMRGLATTGVYGLQQLHWLVTCKPELCQQLLESPFPFFGVITSTCQSILSSLSLPEQAFRGGALPAMMDTECVHACIHVCMPTCTRMLIIRRHLASKAAISTYAIRCSREQVNRWIRAAVDLAVQSETMTPIPWLLCHSDDTTILNELMAMMVARVVALGDSQLLNPDDFPLAIAQARRQLQAVLTGDPRPTTLRNVERQWTQLLVKSPT
eukprot:TRINITY_DN11321_c0_g1_i5.p1 TRINITY_DN11321_c0_g1~~TRINITY_DN11321_c0_g1_i5.p1  ORF type:complete len:468 (+),score=86.25 TRINITY_DN11321_c0_g1_i5:82-1485(+)